MMIGKVRRGWELFEAAAHRGDVPVYQGRVDEGLTESESEDGGQGDGNPQPKAKPKAKPQPHRPDKKAKPVIDAKKVRDQAGHTLKYVLDMLCSQWLYQFYNMLVVVCGICAPNVAIYAAIFKAVPSGRSASTQVGP